MTWCTFVNLWSSKVFHTLSAMRSIRHTCILPGLCHVPKFSHTGTLKAFWKHVRHAHVSADRLPSLAHLLSLLRVSSLRQALGGAGLQGGSLNFTRLCSCEWKKSVASLPRLYTFQMMHNYCISHFSSKDRNASINTCIKSDCWGEEDLKNIVHLCEMLKATHEKTLRKIWLWVLQHVVW